MALKYGYCWICHVVRFTQVCHVCDARLDYRVIHPNLREVKYVLTK